MLIPGAIISTKYGIPHITSAHAATRRIPTGDQIKNSGFLGMVTIDYATV